MSEHGRLVRLPDIIPCDSWVSIAQESIDGEMDRCEMLEGLREAGIFPIPASPGDNMGWVRWLSESAISMLGGPA